jgi:transcriptional regulator with XRE-family HTH domain
MAARSWRDVRAQAARQGLIDEARVAEQHAELQAQVRAHKLAEIRQSKHVTQAALAAAMGVAQPRVSAIERGQISATELGTLRSYVEALGGRLRLVADFGDQTVTVESVRGGRVEMASPRAVARSRRTGTTRNVVPNSEGGWDVTGAGVRRSAHADTQAEAIARAKQIVHNAGGGEVTIHGRDGKIRSKDKVEPGIDPRKIPG